MTTKLLVEGLLATLTDKRLKDFFRNHRRGGGGPVSNVLREGSEKAIITFESSDAVVTVLKRGNTVTIDEVIYNVSAFPAQAGERSESDMETDGDDDDSSVYPSRNRHRPSVEDHSPPNRVKFATVSRSKERSAEKKIVSKDHTETFSKSQFGWLKNSSYLDSLKSKYPCIDIELGNCQVTFKNCKEDHVLEEFWDELGKCSTVRPFFPENMMDVLKMDESIDRINTLLKNEQMPFFLFLDQGIVKIFGYKNGVEKENVIKRIESEILTKTKKIDAKQWRILSSSKGKSHLSKLFDNLKSRRHTVEQHDSERCLCFTGFKEAVNEWYVEIDTFLEDNKTLQATVPYPQGKQIHIERFKRKESERILQEFKNDGIEVKIVPGAIKLDGLEQLVKDAQHSLGKFIEKIHKEVVELKHFGVKEFLTGEGKQILEQISQDMECTLLIGKDENSSGSQQQKTGQGKPLPSPKPANCICYCKYKECGITIMQGDILSLPSDATICALDDSFSFKDGMASAILKQGGEEIVQEFENEARKGEDKIIDVRTPKLKCQHILFITLKEWDEEDPTAGKELLLKSVSNCLKVCSISGYTSVALPLIGNGKLKVPSLAASTALMKAVKMHLEADSSLQKIFLCDMREQNVNDLMDRFDEAFSDDVEEIIKLGVVTERGGKASNSGTATGQTSGATAAAAAAAAAAPAQAASAHPKKRKMKFDNITVTYKLDEITKMKSDVVVVPVHKSLDLSKGAVAQAVLQCGGDSVQDDLRSSYPDGLRDTSFAIVSGGKLLCKKLYCFSLSKYNGKNERWLTRNLLAMFEKANQDKASDISIPALGTGRLGFPNDVSGHCIKDAIIRFSKVNHQSLHLKKIAIVIYHKDTEVDQAFSKVFRDELLESSSSFLDDLKQTVTAKISGGPKLSLTKGTADTHTFGPLTLKIEKGDLFDVKCDAIACGIKNSMELETSGAVCRAILQKSGTQLQDECEKQVGAMEADGITVTSAPALKCGHIIFVSMTRFARSWKAGVKKVLEEAEEQKFKSLALPAFGTGSKGANIQHLKQEILLAISTFGKTKPKHLHKIQMVIHGQTLYDIFTEDSSSTDAHATGHHHHHHQQHHSGSQDRFGKVSKLVYVQVYSDSPLHRRQAIDRLIHETQKAFKQTESKDPQFEKLTREEINTLEEAALKRLVRVEFARQTIHFMGFDTEKVHDVVKLAIELKANVLERHYKENIKKMALAICWQYTTIGKTADSAKTFEFDTLTSQIIENAYKNQKSSVNITDSKNRKYKIDFTSMQECLLTNDGKTAKPIANISRRDLAGEGFSLPSNWDKMSEGEDLKVVPLKNGSKEFKSVEDIFKNCGAQFPLKKVLRIQNKSQYQQYMGKKSLIDKQNPNNQNERKLFHGTNAEGIPSINESGFSRNYCGKNGTAYGNGVYFAEKSSYSVNYAKADGNGERWMYLVKVLVGISHQSQSGMSFLPNKPNTYTPYDSGKSGGIYVIFHDSQTYPEYLMVF